MQVIVEEIRNTEDSVITRGRVCNVLVRYPLKMLNLSMYMFNILHRHFITMFCLNTMSKLCHGGFKIVNIDI